MQKILRKRILRELKENVFRYLALGFLIFLGMYLVVGMVGAAETVITRVDEYTVQGRVEDGEFQMIAPLKEKEVQELEEEAMVVENKFSLDFSLGDNSVIRIFENRKKLNKVQLEEGRMADKEGEAVLEKRYGAEHGISIGDEISIAGDRLKITGIGTVADYDGIFQELTDSSANSKKFGLAFVTEVQYEKMRASKKALKTEDYTYAFGQKGSMTEEKRKEKLKKYTVEGTQWQNLIRYVDASDNPRIKASAEDQVLNKYAGLTVGAIVMVLFTYVISVFVAHCIEKESSIIGAFYALGVKKKELLIHYLTLPAGITFFAGICGTLLGFSKYGINVQLESCYGYFSIPELETVYPIYLMLYGVAMPPVTAVVVNSFMINQKLSYPVLKLIKNEPRQGKTANVRLGKMGFMKRFAIRQMLREKRSVFTVVFGMLISLMVFMMGTNCYALCENVRVKNQNDTRFKYMYTYKFPDREPVEAGEAVFAKKLSKEAYGNKMDVTVLGIDDENPYFDATVEEGKDKIVISSAVAQKFGLKVGEELVLSDEDEGIHYGFRITGITQYSVGLYVFMGIDDMRELFHMEEDYYNVVLSDHKLAIDPQKLYGVTTKSDIKAGAEVFIELLRPLFSMLFCVSILIFVIVMYLMMKVMVDRSALGISLVKIFGYRTKEIRRLYLDCNFYLIAGSALICIPLAKMLVNAIYPYILSNVAIGMDLVFSWQVYPAIYGVILGIYLGINQVLILRMKKITPAEVLKNRE